MRWRRWRKMRLKSAPPPRGVKRLPNAAISHRGSLHSSAYQRASCILHGVDPPPRAKKQRASSLVRATTMCRPLQLAYSTGKRRCCQALPAAATCTPLARLHTSRPARMLSHFARSGHGPAFSLKYRRREREAHFSRAS